MGGPDQVSRQVNAYVCYIKVSFFVDFPLWPMFVLLNVPIFHHFSVVTKFFLVKKYASSMFTDVFDGGNVLKFRKICVLKFFFTSGTPVSCLFLHDL